MENNFQFLRDKVFLSQNLVDYLQKKSIYSITIVARIITINENLVFDNRDLILIGETIVGNDKLVTVNPPSRSLHEFGSNGFDGKKIEIYSRKGGNFSVSVLGGNGVKGGKGKSGQTYRGDIKNPFNYHGNKSYSGTKGEKGLIGGNGGNGGQIITTYLSEELININKIILTGGNGGDGGDGGDGGYDVSCRIFKNPKETTGLPPQKKKDDYQLMEICDYVKQLESGDKGDLGTNGSNGKLIYLNPSTDEWFEKINLLVPSLSDYKTKVAEYLFRSVNNPIEISNFGSSKEIIMTALSELESAIKLNKDNVAALLLYKRITVFHTPLGQYRFVDIKPDFNEYKSNYTEYFPFVKDTKDIATNFYTQSNLKSSISKVLDVQKSTIVATRKTIEAQRDSLILRIENKTKELNDRIKRSKELEAQIQKRKKELEDDANSGIKPFVKDIKVAIAIGSAIYTGGASLMTAFNDIAKITDSATDIYSAISELDSFDDVKSAFGELVDISRGDLEIKNSSYEKLFKGAKDFTDAANSFDEVQNKFNSSTGILLDIEKTINQIKGINPDDARLKELLNEQADNLKEIINVKKEIETLNYDKEVAIKQIEIMKITEQKVSTILITEEENRDKLFLTFLEIMKVSQANMDFIMLQIFYAYRSLEIQRFKNYSDKISYHFGYFHPDLELDCLEFNDESTQMKLFEVYNKSWSEISQNVINAQNEFDDFSKTGNWNSYILRLNFAGQKVKSFAKDPLSKKLSFAINESNTELLNKKFIRVQAVKISFINAKIKSGNSQFNATIYQSGKVSQITENNNFQSILLEGISTNISDVETLQINNDDFGSFDGVIGFKDKFRLSYRPIFSNYEIDIEPLEINKVDLSTVSRVQVWFKCVYRD